jgi:hypothetical protein
MIIDFNNMILEVKIHQNLFFLKFLIPISNYFALWLKWAHGGMNLSWK